MLCDEHVNQELEQGTVGKDGAQPPIPDIFPEQVNGTAVQGGKDDIEEPIPAPEIASGILGIPCREHGGDNSKHGVEKQVAQKGGCQEEPKHFPAVLPSEQEIQGIGKQQRIVEHPP